MILSVGYRVNSKNAVLFRRWANSVLKEYLFKGYAISRRIADIENQLQEHRELLGDHDKKIDFFIHTALPPVEGVFFEGQIFDAYVFVVNLVKSAKCRIVLMDNYVDDTVLVMLSKRSQGVQAEIRTGRISKQLQLDLLKHNSQYPPISIECVQNIHDRFMIVDNIVYHIGASLKDLGRKLFAFSKMELSPDVLLNL